MKGVILFVFALSVCFAQNYNWSGTWTVWDAIPYNYTVPKEQCCIPSNITAVPDNDIPNKVTFFITFNSLVCPNLNGRISFTETINQGRFVDPTPNLVVYMANATYFPNNNTIRFAPGINGNCILELGNNISIVTNTTDINARFNWEGAWYYHDNVFPAFENVQCCKPLQPLVIKKDPVTNTIVFIEDFPSDPACGAYRGQTTLFNVSIFTGSFEANPAYRAYYLQNQTVLFETGACWYIWDKTPPTLSGPRLIISSIAMLLLSMGLFI